jgi:hypothetical protein
MEPVTISLLPLDKLKCVKIIRINRTIFNAQLEAYVVYARTFVSYDDFKQRKKHANEHFQDDLDDFIIQSIKQQYPDATVSNLPIYFDDDETRLKKQFGAMHHDIMVIHKLPTINGDFEKYFGETFYRYDYKLDLFIPPFADQPKYFMNEGVFVNYDIVDKEKEHEQHERFYQVVLSIL